MATKPPKGMKHHCERHDQWYTALGNCEACTDDPGPAPDETVCEDPVAFPDGIPDVDANLRGLVEDLDYLINVRNAIWRKGDAIIDVHLANSAIKAASEIAKIRRDLLAAGYKRVDAVEVDRREKRLVKSTRGSGR